MLPAAASIRKQGANKGATVSFLISTPESGVDSIAITYALLDPIMTVVRPCAAFFTATCAGLAENALFYRDEDRKVVTDKSCPVDGCCDGVDCPDEIHRNHHTIWEKIVAGLRFGYKDVWGDIAGWFFVGVLLAALITVAIPEDLMIKLLGGGLSSMLVMLVIGIPLYICATASTPVAAALIMKGVSPGAALVFLLVGPATNVASIAVLSNLLGKKSTILYLTILSICAVICGLGVDYLYSFLGISPRAIVGEITEIIPEGIKIVSVVLLLIFSVAPMRRFFRKKPVVVSQTHFISPFPQPLSEGSVKDLLAQTEKKDPNKS